MTLTLDMIGDYISSGATGWVFEHAQEPDKVIKIMKAFPRVGGSYLDAFQYNTYLQDRHIVRYNPAHNDYDHDWSVGMLWRPMSAKMQMYMFDELMNTQRSGQRLPTGLVKLYDSVQTFLPLGFTKDIHDEIATQNRDHAEAWEDNFLSIRGPGHRNAYLVSMEKLNIQSTPMPKRPRKEVFKEVATYLWDNLNLVTRDTATAGNYGYRNNNELVIFDPIVSPLPYVDEWRPTLAPNNVLDRLRYNYFSYLFTNEPFPVESMAEARSVNRMIKKIDKQLANNTFTTIEREAETFNVEGFPGSEIEGVNISDWSVRDLMYSNAVTGNFLEDQAKFNYGLNAEDKNKQTKVKFSDAKNWLAPAAGGGPSAQEQIKNHQERYPMPIEIANSLEELVEINNNPNRPNGAPLVYINFDYITYRGVRGEEYKLDNFSNWLHGGSSMGVKNAVSVAPYISGALFYVTKESNRVDDYKGYAELYEINLKDYIVISGHDMMEAVLGGVKKEDVKILDHNELKSLNAESMYHRDSIYELYLRMPTGKEEILSRQDNFNLALAQMCGLILGNKVVYEIGIYGPRLADPYYSKDLLVRHKYGEFTGNDPDAVRMARDNCLQPKGFDSGFQEEFEAPAPKQTKVKFPRAKADKIVTKVENHLRPMVEKMMACGSYRRGAQMIGDIDFVVIPKEGYTLPNMLPPNEGVNWVGDNKAQVIIDGEKVDFKVTTPAAWGATVLYFTGPADFNIKYRWMAKRKGLKLSEYGLFDRNTDQYLAGATEADIFTALGRPYKDPAQRQGFSKSKKKTTKKAEEVEMLLHPSGARDDYIDLLEEFPNAKNLDALISNPSLSLQLEKGVTVLNSMEELLAQDFFPQGTQPLYYVNFPLTVYRGVTTLGGGKRWTWKRWLDGNKMGASHNMGVYDSQPATLSMQEALDYANARHDPDFELYAINIQDYFVNLPRPSQDYIHKDCNPVVEWTGDVRDNVWIDGSLKRKYRYVSCDNKNHFLTLTPVIFILGGALYEDMQVIWDADVNASYFDAEEIRCCKECDKTTGLTTIQAGTYCYDCLPINLGAEDNLDYRDYLNDLRTYPELKNLSDEQLLARGIDCLALQTTNKESFDAEDNYDATYGKEQAKIRRKLKKSIKKQNTHGTKAGQWSARKSQLLKQKYEAACERRGLRAYKGKKTSKQNDLSNWSKQQWGTASGKKSSVTGEPYFPAGAVKALKKQGLYAKATRQKRAATKAGKQRASYSKDIQNVVADYRAESELGPICPICYNYIPNNQTPGAYPGALARYDNETEICSECGTAEALAGMMAGAEAIAEWENSNRTWRDYQMLIMTTKSNIPEIMFGRGPEMEQLRELQKKMDDKKSEGLIQEVFNKRTGDPATSSSLMELETPMAINLSRYNYEKPFVFEGLGSLFGAESKDSKVFGVQRHDAHRAGLHYDLRLERDGVLKSWSIPKGMPTDNRHLAIATDDHAMSWLDFDGDIPDGTYGAGKVSLDNKSTFQTVSYSPKKWVFYVNSGKYEGKYTLVHWQDNKWLISRNKNQSMEAEEVVTEIVSPLNENVTRSLGEIPDNILRYMFKRGDISKMQMEIGIGLKMQAEEKVFNAWYDLATDRQRNYIKRLGGNPHPDLNRRQASKLINQLARTKKALDQIDIVVEEE